MLGAIIYFEVEISWNQAVVTLELLTKSSFALDLRRLIEWRCPPLLDISLFAKAIPYEEQA